MTKALISLPSLSLIAAPTLSDCSLPVGGDSSSQVQGQQTQVGQTGSDSVGSAGSAQGSAPTSASGTTASADQAVAGYEPGQIPPIPMISLPNLSLLTQSTSAFTPDLARSVTSQPGITVRPARCDTSGSLVSDSTVLSDDGSMTTNSGTTSVINNDDGSGTYSDGKVSITVGGGDSDTYSNGKVSITVNGDSSGAYGDDYLSVTANGDGSGTYNNSTTGESITLGSKGSGTYNRSGVSITNNGDDSGTYSGGELSITNNGSDTAIVNNSTISAKPVLRVDEVGTFPPTDATRSVQSCGTVTTLEGNVLFGFGPSKLRDEASTTLTNLATVIKSSEAPKVQIQGHTNSVSDGAFSRKLSEQRAQTILSVLKSSGMAADLEAAGYDETKPVAPNGNPDGSDNPAGHHLNRRVEVSVPTSWTAARPLGLSRRMPTRPPSPHLNTREELCS